MNYQELRSKVIAIQERIKPLNHKLDNPRITHASRCSIESELRELKIMLYDASCDMQSHPDYNGSFSFAKENNPYK